MPLTAAESGTERKYALRAFLLSFILGVLSFAWTMLLHRGLFSVAGDFNVQQIPFAMYANDAVKSGNVIWDWSLDLGSNFIGGMTFYILGNPSFWLSLLFPSDMFMFVVGWLYILKYAVAGLTSFLWIRRFVKNPNHALIASVMYAFSGFMNENLLFYHFHDVAALFPLLLITFDDLMEKRRRGPFIFAVCINAIVNYFFFFGEVYFLIAYFILRYVFGEGKETWKRLPEILIEGILGVLLGMAWLLPSVYFTMQNPRVKFDYYGNNSLVFTAERYLYILKALIFPGEVMSDQSAVIEHNFASCAAYIPLAGMTLVIAFFMLYRKHWVKRMLIWCLVMAVVPFFNASFSLFAGLYHRWFYMPVLLFALAGGLVLDRIENDSLVFMSPTPSQTAVTKATVIWGVITIAFIAFLLFVPWSSSEASKIYHDDVFAAWSAVAAAGTILTWVILTQTGKKRLILFGVMTCAFAIGTSAALLHLYQRANGELADGLYDRLTTSREFEDPGPSYRFANSDNPETLTHGFQSTANFCSTVSGSIFRFYTALGLKRDVKSPTPPEGLYELVSARFRYETEEKEELGEPLKTYEGKKKRYFIYENGAVPPIGFTYNTYMTATEFGESDKDLRAILMLKTLVVPDEKEDLVKECLRHYDEAVDGVVSSEALEEISEQHLEECSADVMRTTSSYSSIINADSEKYAFFSIPNDTGWSAKVDGEDTEIIDINGFMAVRVHAGANHVEFRYQVPGLATGLYLSLAALILSMLYIVYSIFTKGHKKAARKFR